MKVFKTSGSFSFFFLLITTSLLDNMITDASVSVNRDSLSSKMTKNNNLTGITVSERYLISDNKARSKLVCAAQCDLEPRCKTFRFEKSSAKCFLYSEVVTGGCNAPVLSNISSYYTHQERLSAWFAFIYEDTSKMLYIYDFEKNSWEEFKLNDAMSQVHWDVNRQRIFWFDTRENKIWSSRLLGNDKKRISTTRSEISDTSLDSKNGRLYYCGGNVIEFIDLHSGKQTNVLTKKGARFIRLYVDPEMRLIFSEIVQKGIIRIDYDSKTTQTFLGFERGYQLTFDPIYHRLIWTNEELTHLISENVWGEDRVEVPANKELFMGDINFIPWNGVIYTTSSVNKVVKMLDCEGNLIKSLSLPGGSSMAQLRSLIFISEREKHFQTVNV